MLRPTFLSFETAKRALTSSQLGLDTVGHNISNVNTPGYTRQRIDQVSFNITSNKAKYQAYGVQFPGQGAEVTAITQIRDPFLDKRYRLEAANTGEYAAIGDGLDRLNSVFDEIMKTGSHVKMDEFLTQLDQLMATSDSKEQATVLRNKAEQIAKVLNTYVTDLDKTIIQQREEMQFSIETVNSLLEQIADLNVRIKEDNFYGNPSNELNDMRNLLIDQLSELVEVDVKRTPYKVTEDLTISQLSIEIRRSGDNLAGIPPVVLVNSGEFNKLEMFVDETSGETYIKAVDGLTDFPLYRENATDNDITKELFSGSLKGQLDILNGKGIFSGTGIFASQPGNTFRGIPYYQAALDDYANRLASIINDNNAIKLRDLNGNIYDANGDGIQDELRMDLFATNDGSSTITARNICISQGWLNNPMYINRDDTCLEVDSGGQLIVWDETTNARSGCGININQVASVAPDGTFLDSSGVALTNAVTGNPLKLEDILRTSKDGSRWDIQPADIPADDANARLMNLKIELTGKHTFSNGFNGTFQEYVVAFQADMALDSELNTNLLDASMIVLTGIANSRDAVSAVSIDEEGINMMTFQNYYNAAARYMTTLDEALDKIINGMGVVGR